MTVRAYAASVLQKKKKEKKETQWTNFLCMQLQKLFPMLLPEAFSGNLKPVCANESWSPASVQPLSAVVQGLGHSWSIPLCFHGSVWSLSAAAERSPLTGARPDRVNVEFTRLTIPLSACPPLRPARLLSSLSPLCVFFNRALLLPNPSPLPSLCVPPQRWHCRRFLWERRDLRWSESADVFPAPCEPHHHRRAEIGRTKSTSVTTCSIIHSPPAMCIPVFPPAGSVSSSPDLICPRDCAARYTTVHPRWTRQWMTICSSLRPSTRSMQTTCLSSKSCRASWRSWSSRWRRFPSGTTATSPWKRSPPRLSCMTGTGEDLISAVQAAFQIKKKKKEKTSYRIIYNPSIPPRVSRLHPQQQCFEAAPLWMLVRNFTGSEWGGKKPKTSLEWIWSRKQMHRQKRSDSYLLGMLLCSWFSSNLKTSPKIFKCF